MPAAERRVGVVDPDRRREPVPGLGDRRSEGKPPRTDGRHELVPRGLGRDRSWRRCSRGTARTDRRDIEGSGRVNAGVVRHDRARPYAKRRAVAVRLGEERELVRGCCAGRRVERFLGHGSGRHLEDDRTADRERHGFPGAVVRCTDAPAPEVPCRNRDEHKVGAATHVTGGRRDGEGRLEQRGQRDRDPGQLAELLVCSSAGSCSHLRRPESCCRFAVRRLLLVCSLSAGWRSSRNRAFRQCSRLGCRGWPYSRRAAVKAVEGLAPFCVTLATTDVASTLV